MAFLARVRRAVPFLVVLAAALWLWSVAESFAISTRLGRIGPEAWPKMVLLLILLAALWGVVEACLKARPDEVASVLIKQATRSAGHEQDAEQALEGESEGPVEHRPAFALAGIGAMLVYVAAIPYLGYGICTFLLLLAIMLLAGYRKPVSAAVIALLGTLAFFFVFQRIAYISLPLGVGVFKEFSTELMTLMGVR
jgi:putative tricarboxylic transport membrane protein